MSAVMVAVAPEEVAQEAVDIAARTMVDENYDGLGEEAKQRLVESGVTAFFVGGTFGGIALGVSGRQGLTRQGQETPAQVIPGDEKIVEPVEGIGSEPGSLLDVYDNKLNNIPKPKTTEEVLELPIGEETSATGEIAFIPKNEAGKNTQFLEFHTEPKAALGASVSGVRGDPSEFVFVEATSKLQKGDSTVLQL